MKIENKNQIIELVYDKISKNKDSLLKQWNNPIGSKTKCFYIDNLLPAEVFLSVYKSFPRDADGFFNLDTFREKKKTCVNLEDYDPILGNITYAIQDKKIIDIVSEICGFNEIEPDPKLYAGGLSIMFKNGFLNPHLDNSHDSDRKRYRRLNLLYYVTPDWKTDNGGNLEIWDKNVRKQRTITAYGNRLVVMETNKESWHSVSKVIDDRPRCCVSNYYFSKKSPDNTEYFHVTSFTGRPKERFKRLAAIIDNSSRNTVSKFFKIGRGKVKKGI